MPSTSTSRQADAEEESQGLIDRRLGGPSLFAVSVLSSRARGRRNSTASIFGPADRSLRASNRRAAFYEFGATARRSG